MKITDFADVTGLNLNITYTSNWKDSPTRWTCSFKDAQIRVGTAMKSVYGMGVGPLSAVADYLKKIRGKKLIVSKDNKRQEFNVPKKLRSM